jgi:8-oxo-dGTP pyrophosphatase MutT (NUDIX family)
MAAITADRRPVVKTAGRLLLWTLMMLRLQSALASRSVRRAPQSGRISAAVLIPIFEAEGAFYVVLTERTHMVSTHKGQISFPGGSRDPVDVSLRDTALRECAEEVGISSESVQVIGQLDDCPTHVSNYIIAPFVGVIPWPHEFRANERETAGIIEAPIADLLDGQCLTEDTQEVDGVTIPAYFYTYRGKVIWGATARILKQFLGIWQSPGNLGAR